LATPITYTDFKSLARAISLVENETAEGEALLPRLQSYEIPVVGITGPPGAGKSTLLNAVLHELLSSDKKIGLILVDPSSPFHFGALLGDRLRLSQHFNNENIFIRSVATRGSLGGLSDKIIEILEVMKAFPFDYIFIETVGVGQSEVEIAGIADTTVVVLVPEAGDSIQAMKAGLMEVADIFVINKSDRPGADMFLNNLSLQLHLNDRSHIPIVSTIASESQGIKELINKISESFQQSRLSFRKALLFTEKVYRIIQKRRMQSFDKSQLRIDIEQHVNDDGFSIFKFAQKYL
jgi:LAO/AO transport system kinase